MATIENLKDKIGNTIYPVTKINAVFDNNNTDVGTLISNEATARQNADTNFQNQLTPSSITKIASNSATTYGSNNLWYMTIGKLVVVQMPYVSCKPDLDTSNVTVLWSGLPTPKVDNTEIIFYLNTADSGDLPMRVKLWDDGTIRMHWTGYSASKSYSGTLVYVKE